jgi:hypothetical protein
MHREARLDDTTVPMATAPQNFLACQDGCGLPAQWVLTSLARGRERPATEALCRECLTKRFRVAEIS